VSPVRHRAEGLFFRTATRKLESCSLPSGMHKNVNWKRALVLLAEKGTDFRGCPTFPRLGRQRLSRFRSLPPRVNPVCGFRLADQLFRGGYGCEHMREVRVEKRQSGRLHP